MIIMDMENTRRLLEEILSYSLYTDDNLSTELKSKLNSIITFLNQNTDNKELPILSIIKNIC